MPLTNNSGHGSTAVPAVTICRRFSRVLDGLCRATLTLAGFTIATSCFASEPNETVYFAFDDHSIPWRDNLQLKMQRASKHPENPVLKRGPKGSPDFGHAILYGTVIHDGDRFRMWYLGMPDGSLDEWKTTRWRPMCYAESHDGVTWSKPNLGLVEVDGNKKNNACRIESDQHFLTQIDDFLSVIHDPEDPDPSRRYKCAFIAHLPWDSVRGGIRDVGETPRESVQSRVRLAMMVTAVSVDGLRWKVVGDRPAVNEKLEVSSLYRFGDFYYAAGQQLSPWSWKADGSDVKRMMTVFRSSDFERWSSAKATGFLRTSQRIAVEEKAPQQTHMGAGLWNRGNVMVGLYGMWQDGPQGKPAGAARLWGTHVDLGLVISNDGIRYREPVTDHRVLSHGKPGEWDDIALLQGHAFANVGDQTYFWYSHWDTSGQLRNMDIGLAKLRRDGFGSLTLHNSKALGHFETKTFAKLASDHKLVLNVDGVTRDQPLRVELLDEKARPIPGYSGKQAAVVTENSVAAEVTWPSTSESHLPQDKKFAVRVIFRAHSEANVYCLYLRTTSTEEQR